MKDKEFVKILRKLKPNVSEEQQFMIGMLMGIAVLFVVLGAFIIGRIYN